MVADKQAVSFDQIIESDRKKKQNEVLASQILGKSKKNSAPRSDSGNKAQNVKPGSLASRVGVTKRSASANSTPTQTQRNPAPATVTSTRSRYNTIRKGRREQLLSALNKTSGQATVRKDRGGLSIKGASGPFIVVGSNFAPGTIAADIQAAIEPVSGPMLSCRVVSHQPAVTAEFAFAEKWKAENVVANFHNQRADGRILSMILQPPGTNASVNRDMLSSQMSFNELREQKDRERRQRLAGPGVQDGSYGFSERHELLQDPQAKRYVLYSDDMMLDSPAEWAQSRKRWQR